MNDLKVAYEQQLERLRQEQLDEQANLAERDARSRITQAEDKVGLSLQSAPFRSFSVSYWISHSAAFPSLLLLAHLYVCLCARSRRRDCGT